MECLAQRAAADLSCGPHSSAPLPPPSPCGILSDEVPTVPAPPPSLRAPLDRFAPNNPSIECAVNCARRRSRRSEFGVTMKMAGGREEHAKHCKRRCPSSHPSQPGRRRRRRRSASARRLVAIRNAVRMSRCTALRSCKCVLCAVLVCVLGAD